MNFSYFVKMLNNYPNILNFSFHSAPSFLSVIIDLIHQSHFEVLFLFIEPLRCLNEFYHLLDLFSSELFLISILATL